MSDSLQVGQWLEADGADFIHLSLIDASAPPPFEPDVVTPVVSAFKQALPELPILVAGGIWDATGFKNVLDAGADIAVVGRAAIGNPDWATEISNVSYQPIPAPWTVEHLNAVAVGAAFVNYLKRMNGLVEQ